MSLLQIDNSGGSSGGETLDMADVAPPDPPLAGPRVALRPFRAGDARAVAAACRDPDIPRFTMMPDGLTEAGAAEWIEQGLAWWRRGVARFAIVMPPGDECVGQIGLQLDLPARRAEAFYWLARAVRGAGSRR